MTAAGVPMPPSEPHAPALGLGALFVRFLRFGLLAWGGPVAQIAMLRRELVDEERWIGSDRFNRTLAVYQALPGPEAHELAVYFGYLSRGRIGGLLAGLGFMIPGLLLMLGLAWAYVNVGLDSPLALAFFAGAQAAVLALIVRAVHRIGAHAVTTRWLGIAAAGAFAGAVLGVSFVILLPAAGLFVLLASGGRRLAAAAVLLVAVVAGAATAAPIETILPGPPPGAPSAPEPAPGQTADPLELLASGLRAGFLTFGGAYTAIPFLEADVEAGDWMAPRTFLDGVALGGVLPAPLVIFATFVGFVAGGLGGALAITVGIFAPAFAITLVGHGQLERLVHDRRAHALLDGVTAGVVGLVAATALLLAPAAIRGPASAAIFGLALLVLYRWPTGLVVPLVVVGAGTAGLALLALAGTAP